MLLRVEEARALGRSGCDIGQLSGAPRCLLTGESAGPLPWPVVAALGLNGPIARPRRVFGAKRRRAALPIEMPRQQSKQRGTDCGCEYDQRNDVQAQGDTQGTQVPNAPGRHRNAPCQRRADKEVVLLAQPRQESSIGAWVRHIVARRVADRVSLLLLLHDRYWAKWRNRYGGSLWPILLKNSPAFSAFWRRRRSGEA